MNLASLVEHYDKLTALLGALFWAGLAVAAAWGMVKIMWQRAFQAPLPRNTFTLAMDAFVEWLPNALGFTNKLLQGFGKPPLFVPTAPQAPTPPQTPALPEQK